MARDVPRGDSATIIGDLRGSGYVICMPIQFPAGRSQWTRLSLMMEQGVWGFSFTT